MINRIKKFLFSNTDTRQTFAKNTFWLSLSEIIGRLLRMILIIYAARILGTEGWGIFSYALSLGSLIMIFSDIGLNNLITREITQKKEGYENFISTALIIKAIILGISIVALLIIAPYISNIPEAKNLIPFIAIILLFDSIRDFYFAINRAFEKMERELIVKVSMSITMLVVGIILLTISPIPQSLAIGYALGCIVGFIVAFFLIKKDAHKIFYHANKKLTTEILKTTWPLALIGLIGTIMANTDIYMLGIWKNANEIGLYSSVQRIQQFIMIIPSMIGTASFPIISRLAHNDLEKFKSMFEKIMTTMFIICIPIVLGGLFLSDQIVLLVFGSEYVNAIPIFRVLIIMLIPAFTLILLSNGIFAFNKQKKVTAVYIIGMILNVFFNIILIPPLGATGSAIATLLSSVFITVLHWKHMKNIIYFKIGNKLNKILLASIIMMLCLTLLKAFEIHTLIMIILSSVIYIILLFIFKEPIINEFKKIYEKN